MTNLSDRFRNVLENIKVTDINNGKLLRELVKAVRERDEEIIKYYEKRFIHIKRLLGEGR